MGGLFASFHLFRGKIAQRVTPLLHVEVKVVPVCLVRFGSESGTENFASAVVDFPEESSPLIPRVPIIGNAYVLILGGDEFTYINRVGKSVLAYALSLIPIPRPALVAGQDVNAHDRCMQLLLSGWSYRFVEPQPQSLC